MRYVLPTLINIHHLGPHGDRNISGTCSACGVTLLAWLGDSEPVGPDLEDKFKLLFRNHVEECHPRNARLQKIAIPELSSNRRRKRPVSELACIAG
jgi:hypothetical protein